MILNFLVDLRITFVADILVHLTIYTSVNVINITVNVKNIALLKIFTVSYHLSTSVFVCSIVTCQHVISINRNRYIDVKPAP